MPFVSRILSTTASLVLAVVFVSQVTAAPPPLDYLYPAGGQRGQTITVTAGGTFKTWPVKVWTDRDEIKIVPTKDKGKLSITIPKNAKPGVCWLRLHDQDGASPIRPFQIGVTQESIEKEPNNEPEKAQSVSEKSLIMNGRLQSRGDVDVFSLTLKKGDTLIASLQANEITRSPMDGILQLLSADGFVLAQNDDYHGMDPQLVYPVTEDGVYFVRIFSFPATATSSISFAGGNNFVYRLTLTTEGFADHAHPIAVSKEHPQPVEVVGWNLPADTKPYQAIDGHIVHPKIANVISVRDEQAKIVKEHANNADNPPPLEIPTSIAGHIHKSKETDVFAVKMKKGQRLQVDIIASGAGSPLDPVLTFSDSSGKLIKESMSRTIGQDPSLLVSATKDGVYRVTVTDLHNRGGKRFFYLLQLSEPKADFTLKTTKDQYVVTAGKPLEISITIIRINNFKEPVTIRAEGLPTGIQAEDVKISAKDKSVKLVVKCDDKLVSGPFRIVGIVSGKEERIRVVMATATEINATTPFLWISSAKKKK